MQQALLQPNQSARTRLKFITLEDHSLETYFEFLEALSEKEFGNLGGDLPIVAPLESEPKTLTYTQHSTDSHPDTHLFLYDLVELIDDLWAQAERKYGVTYKHFYQHVLNEFGEAKTKIGEQFFRESTSQKNKPDFLERANAQIRDDDAIKNYLHKKGAALHKFIAALHWDKNRQQRLLFKELSRIIKQKPIKEVWEEYFALLDESVIKGRVNGAEIEAGLPTIGQTTHPVGEVLVVLNVFSLAISADFSRMSQRKPENNPYHALSDQQKEILRNIRQSELFFNIDEEVLKNALYLLRLLTPEDQETARKHLEFFNNLFLSSYDQPVVKEEEEEGSAGTGAGIAWQYYQPDTQWSRDTSQNFKNTYQLSRNAGFLRNQILYDLFAIYEFKDVDLGHLLSDPEWSKLGIDEVIRQQTLSYLMTLSPEELRQLSLVGRHEISRRILDQILRQHPAFFLDLEFALTTLPANSFSSDPLVIDEIKKQQQEIWQRLSGQPVLNSLQNVAAKLNYKPQAELDSIETEIGADPDDPRSKAINYVKELLKSGQNPTEVIRSLTPDLLKKRVLELGIGADQSATDQEVIDFIAASEDFLSRLERLGLGKVDAQNQLSAEEREVILNTSSLLEHKPTSVGQIEAELGKSLSNLDKNLVISENLIYHIEHLIKTGASPEVFFSKVDNQQLAKMVGADSLSDAETKQVVAAATSYWHQYQLLLFQATKNPLVFGRATLFNKAQDIEDEQYLRLIELDREKVEAGTPRRDLVGGNRISTIAYFWQEKSDTNDTAEEEIVSRVSRLSLVIEKANRADLTLVEKRRAALIQIMLDQAQTQNELDQLMFASPAFYPNLNAPQEQAGFGTFAVGGGRSAAELDFNFDQADRAALVESQYRQLGPEFPNEANLASSRNQLAQLQRANRINKVNQVAQALSMAPGPLGVAGKALKYAPDWAKNFIGDREKVAAAGLGIGTAAILAFLKLLQQAVVAGATLGGAVIGGIGGFLVGGPVGAIIGASVGAGAGFATGTAISNSYLTPNLTSAASSVANTVGAPPTLSGQATVGAGGASGAGLFGAEGTAVIAGGSTAAIFGVAVLVSQTQPTYDFLLPTLSGSLETSKYVSIGKRSSLATGMYEIENGFTGAITYTINMASRDNYQIRVTRMEDILTIIVRNNEDNPGAQDAIYDYLGSGFIEREVLLGEGYQTIAPEGMIERDSDTTLTAFSYRGASDFGLSQEEVRRPTSALGEIDDQEEGDGDMVTQLFDLSTAKRFRYTQDFPFPLSDTTITNTIAIEFEYYDPETGESGTDTAFTSEVICVGDCPLSAGGLCWPTDGYLIQGPYSTPTTGTRSHDNLEAIDIISQPEFGTHPPIYATFDGVAVLHPDGHGHICRESPTTRRYCYGNHVVLTVDNEYGQFSLNFAHLHNFHATLSPGRIQKGQVLGLMGGTGGYGVHLHYEVYRNAISIETIVPEPIELRPVRSFCGNRVSPNNPL